MRSPHPDVDAVAFHGVARAGGANTTADAIHAAEETASQMRAREATP
jgi:hypothetical protein